MSLFNDKLSKLTAGDHVRFTHSSGQVIEGIIVENDGEESLSVQITSLATLRYDQISLVEQYQQIGNLQSAPVIPQAVPIAVPQAEAPESAEDESEDNDNEDEELTDNKSKDGVLIIPCDEEAVSAAFKAMEPENKKIFQKGFDKFKSYLKSGDEDKRNAALDLIWESYMENGLDYDAGASFFVGHIQLASGEYKEAVESFFYADNLRYAYCVAYQKAEETGDKELYTLAGTFAALYLALDNPSQIEEAAQVLYKVSDKSMDISGICYVSEYAKSAEVTSVTDDLIRALGAKTINDSSELSDVRRLLIKLMRFYIGSAIKEKIEEFLPQLPQQDSDSDSDSDSYSDSDSESDSEEEKETAEEVPSEPDVTKEYAGRIVSYKFLTNKGKIETRDGATYTFTNRDIIDPTLKKWVSKISTEECRYIYVRFKLMKMLNEYVAIALKLDSKSADEKAKTTDKTAARVSAEAVPEHTENTGDDMYNANCMFTQKDYQGAIQLYRKCLEGKEWEDAFSHIILCYLALNNEDCEYGYMEELAAFIAKYDDKEITSTKALESLRQYYVKINDYENGIEVLNELISRCDQDDYLKILQLTASKSRCYKHQQNYESAISELLDWLEIVEQNKIREQHWYRENNIYIELAENYFELGDYENSEKYALLAAATERRQSLQRKLADKKAELEAEDEEYEEESEAAPEGAVAEVEETIQEAYDSYVDHADFEAIGKNEKDILSTAFGFAPDQLYCLLTYINTAAEISHSSDMMCENENGERMYVGQVIKAVDKALSFAFDSPFLDSEYLSTNVISAFDETKNYLGDKKASLFAASAMYALFSTPYVADYNTGDFAVVAESMEYQQYPTFLPLINDLTAFRETTGYGMDTFADYKTNNSLIEGIIAEAKDCCKTIDMRSDVYENQGQVRRMREFLFSGEESELRQCLDIVAANDTGKYLHVKKTIEDTFIRAGRQVSSDNIDNRKIDRYIDRFWDMARDVIQDEGRHIARPHDKIKGSKRNNIIIAMRRILSCICDWISVAEHFADNENRFAKDEYTKILPKVKNELSGIIESCAQIRQEKGFDWGTEAVRIAAEELLAKVDGTYNAKKNKYFFIDFLRGEDILLDDNYLPERLSTFCDMKDFNILSRIERHASIPHPSFSERLSEILSNEETKHNFRTATLISAYGSDMEIAEITAHKDMQRFAECRKQAKRRFEITRNDFLEGLELYESYGTLSNVNGEKDRLIALADSWYRISRLTNDYGFYSRLLDVIRENISASAVKKGEQLLLKLGKLTENSEYDFGVFSEELIKEKIADQNYTSAEYIMSCILGGDVNAISDYSEEPFGYFNEFISEHTTNHRIVREAGYTLTESILRQSGKKELESALRSWTNNAHKETKGGANLLRKWIPYGRKATPEQITELLTALGFKPVSVTPDEGVDADAYQVYCRKQIGRAYYNNCIPAFSSKSESEGFRVLCLYGRYDCDTLMDKFRSVNSTAKHTLVFLDYVLNIDDRKKLAQKLKSEKTFTKAFIVVDRVILFYLAKHYAENTIIKRLMAITMPFAYYQPFVESSAKDMPAELFTGREAELASIESPEGANLVFGGRQLGKSVLLKMAKSNVDRNSNGDRAVLIDIKDHTSADAIGVVCSQLIIEGILDESSRCDTWTELAGHIHKRLMDDDPKTRINYLLLMLDEADKFIETCNKTTDQPITAFKSLPSDRFKLVMAGLHNLSRYNREVMHGNSNFVHLESVIIRQFRREEATKLLTSTLAYLGFRFTQEIIDNILASTYNYPGLIQFYCQKLLEAMKNDDYAGYKPGETPPYRVTESHYKKVLSDVVFTSKVNDKLEATLFAEEEGRSNYHIIALIIAYLCYEASDDAGYSIEDILRVARDYNINRVLTMRSEQLSETLNEMCDLNVITEMEDRYSFSTDGFRNLLGNREEIDEAMSQYFGEEVTA
ncbi:MAG: hypothetical protein IJZ51_10400 [Ruminiclostridium sp.]|nr:hypothetical protein [Ruminiclostridium sp.]